MTGSSFASRIAGYFGALFLAAVGLLFYLWYFGLPQLGIGGAGNQHLVKAVQALETKADLRRTLIANGLVERRGDVLVLAESQAIARQLEIRDPAVQPSVERLFERLQRAYPDRYQKILVVDPTGGFIRASSVKDELGRPFHAPALIKRAVQPGTSEMVEELFAPDGVPVLAILRQIHAINSDGSPSDKVVGILVVLVDLKHFLHQDMPGDVSGAAAQGMTMLFDSSGKLLSRSPDGAPEQDGFVLHKQVEAGFEGTVHQTNAKGQSLVVVYRQLPLSSTRGWTLVHYSTKDAVLGNLNSRANTLVLVGLVLTLLALLVMSVVARRLTRPLMGLSIAARQLGAGDLSVRVPSYLRESREITVLSDAFNAMAQSIQKAQLTLEATVLERTAELQASDARHRTLFESTADAVLLVDYDLIIDCNPAALRLFGANTKAAMVGKHPTELSPPNQPDGMDSRVAAQRISERLQSFGSVSFEWLHCRVDSGQTFVAEVLLSSMEVDGRLISQATVRNIGARKKADAELRIAAIAFESQEGMYVTDAQWEILRVNRAFTDITGYAAQEAVGRLPRDLLSSGRHDASFYAAVIQSVDSSGTWQGEIWDRRKGGEVYPAWLMITAVKADDGMVTNYVVTLTDFTARKAAAEEIRNLAFFDSLTGLPNRRLLMDRLTQGLAASLRHQRKGALLFVDLDDFKTLNDTLGHDKGDLLLQQVAQRLTVCIRECDTVARLGGDEFVVMLEDLSNDVSSATMQAEAVAEKILIALNQQYQFTGYEHHSTPSIGITLFGDKQETIDEPLKRADLAMYQAKAAGRNTVRFFDPNIQVAVTARAALEAALREAVERREFILFYQAQVTDKHEITGAEVLVRWRHPQRGMVSPAEFIPLAEETGVILPLGRWVLETACTQLARWATRVETAHLTIAVNVSARQFHQPDFVEDVITLLKLTGANPQRLKIELTESMLVSNIESIVANMHALKQKGVGFSLDDFGTGYSSLSYLKRLPLDQLKIDQGFVRDILIDPNDAAIAKMVVALASSLGLSVIAEGVETEAQRDFLADQGCHAYQGYLFSRPVPLSEFEALVIRP